MIVFRSGSSGRVATPSNPLESGSATGTGRQDFAVRARFFGGQLSGDYDLRSLCSPFTKVFLAKKFGGEPDQNPRKNNSLREPYQTRAVGRSGEKRPNGENFWREPWPLGAEVCLAKSANTVVLRYVKSGERKVGIARLAEGEELKSNILR